MHIDRMIVRDLRALKARDDLLVRPGKPPAEVCLRGVNGSGKTTWLEAVGAMMQWFRRCTQRRRAVEPEADSPLHQAGAVALRLVGLPGPISNLWLCYSKRPLPELPLDDAPIFSPFHPVPSDDLLPWWDAAASRAELGSESDALPNVVLLDATGRYSRPLTRGSLVGVNGDARWLLVKRHDPTARSTGHLEEAMRSLALLRPDRWKTLQETLEVLRPRLQLADTFDPGTQRPRFLLDETTQLTTDDLSAGEQTMLISWVLILRWLSPGGVVLIDEPELHQHAELIGANLQVLSWMVDRLGGQLITASHAREVWEHHRTRGLIVDLAPT